MESIEERINSFTFALRPLSEVRKGYTCFQDEDLLWAKITPCMQNGKSAVVRGLANGTGFGSTEFHVVRSGKRSIPGFLWAVLSMPKLLYAAQGAFAGSSGHQRVPTSFLEQLDIPVPPLDIQRRLVAELDAARAGRDRALAEADAIAPHLEIEIGELLGLRFFVTDARNTYAIKANAVRFSRLDAEFHHPRYAQAIDTLHSANGDVVALDQILLDIAGGATPKAKDESLYTTSGVKFLRILNVKPNRLDYSDLNHIQDEVNDGLLRRSQLDENDVLMTITGRVGTAAVVSADNLPANINQHIVRMRIDSKRCLPKYLAAYLNTRIGTLLSNRPVSGGTRVALDYGSIRQIPVVLPDRAVQEKVVCAVDDARAKEATLRTHAETVWQQARERFEYQLLHGTAP